MMKKGLLFPAILLATLSLFAQPTLQNNIVPNIGDVVFLADADTNSAQPGNAGPNQTWNFAAMQPLNPPSVNQYLAPAGTPYAGDFPTATLVNKVGSGDTAIYAYSRKEANQWLVLGIRSNVFTLDYLNTDAQIKYPLSYNGTYNDDYSYTTDAGTGVNFLSKGSRSVKYDAYGTLTTPYGTFNNAMRIKALTSQLDSATFQGGEFINHIDFITYNWVVPNRPGALVSVSYIHILSETRIVGFDTLFTESGPTKTVNYINTSTTGTFTAPNAPAGLTITALGPNPASDQLTLRFSMESGRVLNLLLTDAAGRVVKIQSLISSPGENEYVIPVGQLAAGAYQITLLDGQKVLTRSWIKQ